MNKKKRLLFIFTTIIVVPLLFLGCKSDSTGPEVDDKPPPPTFSIASTTVQDGGLNIVLFWFTPSEDIELGRTEIKNPVGTDFLFSGQNNLFIGGESYYLDDYLRVSGNWTFRFVGKSSPGGHAFDVRTVVSVGAKESQSP